MMGAMNLSLRQLQYICEVAAAGSVQAASSSLHISPSSILAAISLAESEIGAQIFVRKAARGMFATPVGERFVGSARALLAASKEFDRSIGHLSAQAPDVLRIGCYEPFSVLFIPEFLRRYQKYVGGSEFVLMEGNQEQLDEWLATGALDLALYYHISPPSSENAIPICKVPAHAVLHVDDPLADKEAVSLAELASRPLVLLDLPQSNNYLLTVFEILAQRPSIKFRTKSYQAVRSAIASGFGFSILNMRPIGNANPDPPSIVRRPILDALPPPTLVVSDIYGSRKPFFVRKFIELMLEFFDDVGASGYSVIRNL